MGDFNLDFLHFSSTGLPSPSQSRLKPLVDELITKVGPYGVKQCVVGATRQGRAGQADSGLDHLWTNVPGKMSQIYTYFNGSDHKAGWDIHGEPGNQVPRKSLGLTGNFDWKSRVFVAKM